MVQLMAWVFVDFGSGLVFVPKGGFWAITMQLFCMMEQGIL
jgi:FtsZ-interacting cell division protein YlmF